MSSSFSSTSNDNPQKIHDVFLSFRGEDTRNGFTSHLYHALVREGIRTFMDNDNLVSGNAISEGLMKAIQGSRSSVVILSERYAFSSWCLRELCRIVECMDTSGLIVVPIFYRVDPSHVRKLIGTYKDAFRKHEKNDELDSEMETWRDALKKVGNISGWTIEEKDVEALIIKDFIAKISSRLHIRKESQHELARRSKLQNVVYFDHDLMRNMVNPENAPFVVGKLLDGECPEEFIKGYILTLRSLLPVEQLLKECEKRNRLGLFTEFLEQLLREGSQDVHVHNALGKIIIDSNNNPEQFLTTNQHYDSHVLGEYCEKWNYPTYAAVAYSRGQCDNELINVTNKNALFQLQARYVVERMDGELWKNVLDNRNEYRSKLIDEVITNALPESKSFDQVSAAIEVFSHASISHKLIELLEKIVLQNSVFSGNSELQGLLIQNAIKEDPTRVMGYIKNLDNFDGPAFGLLTEEEQLYEEAFVIYNKFKMNVEAVNVLLDKIQSVDRAAEFASRVKEDAVWNQVRKAQHAAGDANVDHHHHLVNEPVDFDRSLERKRDHPVTATIHSLNSNNNPQKVVAEYEFDVFVTFWNGFIVGEFARFLFDALDREGIRTFFDINDKRKVKSAKTMKAAQSSRISIVILSTLYAFKEENLRNLCKIVECMETSGLIVVPIFYHVNPSHVREQTGRFRRPFKHYENSSRFSTEEVKTWRDALKRVGDMTGWIIPKNFTWDENKKSAELVIADISNRLGILEEENVMDPKSYYEKFPLTGDELYDFSSDEEE